VRLEPKTYEVQELRLGLAEEFETAITEEDVFTFARNTGDENPLHIDAAYARGSRFERRLVHGAFQIGLASAMLGIRLPGRSALLTSVNCRFPSPLYFPCRVSVRGEVISWNPDTASGILKVVVQESNSHVPTAEIRMGFALHERLHGTRPQVGDAPSAGLKTDRKIVVVTGASGGIGGTIASTLAREYFVIALANVTHLDEKLKESPYVIELQADLSFQSSYDKITERLEGDSLYGVVHAAWPGVPHGGLLQVSEDIVTSQLSFGSCQTIRLARLLSEHTEPGGGRLVVLGSIYGSSLPNLNFASYSLGKATIEHTVRLLAPELARKGITANVICPSFVRTGMNKHIGDRQCLKEIAKVPLGRLCEPDDVAGMVSYLLSPEAAFVSGQIIALTGAQL
jgi:NAD(P)-dependent dehydrogenase (short-subunit alcohol dehydrogenase family)/acyl dehydratase